MTPPDPLSLVSWRRAVSALYATIREEAEANPLHAWSTFCTARDALFADHSQSPLSTAQRAAFHGIRYYAYDPDWRVEGHIDRHVAAKTFSVEVGADGAMRLTSVAVAHFNAQGRRHQLTLYWIEGYGGGLFLPFRDGTCGDGSYGGGRYLYDTIKGADLGLSADRIVLDFNFAYNPSCAYNSRWVCPLSPPENQLDMAIEAGEHTWVNQSGESRQRWPRTED